MSHAVAAGDPFGTISQALSLVPPACKRGRIATVECSAESPVDYDELAAYINMVLRMDRRMVLEQARVARAAAVHPADFRSEPVIRHGSIASMDELQAAISGPVSGAAWGSTMRRIGLPAMGLLLLGVSLLSLSVAAGITLSWLALSGLCFANYASARNGELGWILGPVMAGYGTLICFLLAVTALVTAVSA